MKKKIKHISSVIKNKRAFFEYEVLDRFEAGLALVGTEVKSIRAGHAYLADAFCQVDSQGKLELHQMEVRPYEMGNIFNHDPKRRRQLLMHKAEITRLAVQIKERGLSIIPLKLYYKHNRVKVEIALCRGKKLYDKRQAIKEREQKKEIDRVLRYSE